MDDVEFKRAYNESRNGANVLIRHPLVRSFLYSDGVQECAEAGCYWLLDILATELMPIFKRKPDAPMMEIRVGVFNGEARIHGHFSDDTLDYLRHVDWTDMPHGTWTFYVAPNGDGTVTCILPSEY